VIGLAPNGISTDLDDDAIGSASAIDAGLGGSIWINGHGMVQPNAPFGGVKSSGLGVEFGE